MKLTVHRFSSGDESTIGSLMINGDFECFTLEDEYREEKVKGETRIPAGTYTVKFRESESPMTEKYRARYDFFKYHLHVQNVTNFQFIYIHAGNKDDHTDGCLLLGDSANNNQIDDGFIGHSRQAFERVYKKVSKALKEGEPVNIEYIDY